MFSVQDIHIARTVSQVGSVHGAARQLHKTQPAISQALRRLEERLGFDLFDRSGYRVTLTPLGRDFLQQSEALLVNELRLREYAEVLRKGQESTITIAALPILEDRVLLPLLEHISSKFPETSLYLDYEESLGALDRLVSGEADIAICPFQRTAAQFSAIEARVIDRITYVNVIAPQLLAGRDPNEVPRDTISQWNHITLRNANTKKSYSFGADRGGRRWEVNDQRMLSALVRKGLGWGMMPEMAIEEELADGRLVELPIPDLGSRISSNIAAARLQGQVRGPVASELWDQLVAGKVSSNLVV